MQGTTLLDQSDVRGFLLDVLHYDSVEHQRLIDCVLHCQRTMRTMGQLIPHFTAEAQKWVEPSVRSLILYFMVLLSLQNEAIPDGLMRIAARGFFAEKFDKQMTDELVKFLKVYEDEPIQSVEDLRKAVEAMKSTGCLSTLGDQAEAEKLERPCNVSVKAKTGEYVGSDIADNILAASEPSAFSTQVRIQQSIIFTSPSQNPVEQNLDLLTEKLLITGGVVITRFPPEPNGYLHIGHAKAMSLNFGYAKKVSGRCILRFDDTNPEAERIEYIDSIIETTAWLKNVPCGVTYASDYFQVMYELAVELIMRGKAFVCHQKPEDYRGANNRIAKASPWRDRPISESLELFQAMKDGLLPEGSATLRMKMNLDDANPCMWDLVAYRIKYHPHPNVGDKWCIYPSYDFTHCINDSLEHISHSLCTLEYVLRRQSYYWLLDALDLYKPLVWEYARLNITHTVLSKRILVKLVQDGVVNGWDDPRMPTISGYRRRGYSPESINNFCEDIGVTRADNVYVSLNRLEQALRADLEPRAPRILGVYMPIKLHLVNLPEPIIVRRMNIPGKPEAGYNKIKLPADILVDIDDLKVTDHPSYFGLALNTKNSARKWIRLRYGPAISLTNVTQDPETGAITSAEAEVYIGDENIKTRGTLAWVADPDAGCPMLELEGSPPIFPNSGPTTYKYVDANFQSLKDSHSSISVEYRLYNNLFMSEKPKSLKGDDFINDLNKHSLVVRHGYIDPLASMLKAWDHIQLERLGYFNVDPDSFADPQNIRLILNRTTSLNQAKAKPPSHHDV